MTGIEIAVVAYLLFGGKRGSGGSSSPTAPPVPQSTGPAEPIGVRADDGLKLVARANQAPARAWASRFIQQDVPSMLADALARWAGLESSGDPRAVSSLGERGLLQCGAAMAKDGAFTPDEWARLILPTTTSDDHARMAYRFSNWLWQRAKKHVQNPPDNYIDAVWYAKLYHQRPVDVRDGRLHGPALMMARELADRWKGDKDRMHRLRAANVVAWNLPEP